MFDVLIVGAGPAGSCAALRLLALGYRVAILERAAFPRGHIGESLSPGIWNIFDYLQASHCLQVASYIKNLPAQLIWETTQVTWVSAAQRGPGIMVDRGQLDRDLLELCQQRGAVVYQPARIEHQQRNGDRWQVTVKTATDSPMIDSPMKNSPMIDCHYIFNATGSAGVNKANRVNIAPLAVALWADLHLTHAQPETLIEALKNGWLWCAPLANGQTRVLILVDASQLKSCDKLSLFKTLVASSQLIDARQLPADFILRSCPSQAYFNPHSWQPNCLHIGDAAFTLDPLSSTGVEKSMRFALQAVVAYHTLRKTADQQMAQQFYQDKLLSAVVAHRNWTQEFYAKAWSAADDPFWTRRCQDHQELAGEDLAIAIEYRARLQQVKSPSAPAPEPTPVSVSQIMGQFGHSRLKVADNVIYRPMPSVVEDYLQLKIAVEHPGLNQATVFMGSVEIAPLLQALPTHATLTSLIKDWRTIMGQSLATRLVVSLLDSGVLCKS